MAREQVSLARPRLEVCQPLQRFQRRQGIHVDPPQLIDDWMLWRGEQRELQIALAAAFALDRDFSVFAKKSPWQKYEIFGDRVELRAVHVRPMRS